MHGVPESPALQAAQKVAEYLVPPTIRKERGAMYRVSFLAAAQAMSATDQKGQRQDAWVLLPMSEFPR